MTEPVRKSVEVAVPVEAAFRAFHERIADWWPLKEYSAFLEDATDVVFEPHEGGRIYEISKGGKENDWAHHRLGALVALRPRLEPEPRTRPGD